MVGEVDGKDKGVPNQGASKTIRRGIYVLASVTALGLISGNAPKLYHRIHDRVYNEGFQVGYDQGFKVGYTQGNIYTEKEQQFNAKYAPRAHFDNPVERANYIARRNAFFEGKIIEIEGATVSREELSRLVEEGIPFKKRMEFFQKFSNLERYIEGLYIGGLQSPK